MRPGDLRSVSVPDNLQSTIYNLQSTGGQSPISQDWALTLLGAGAVPVPEILRLLRDSGYRGYLSIEWEKHWHRELAEPEEALPQHITQLRYWMEALGT
ncbi:hypothetical protein HC891_03350 [Candidatus Gracilibacteria bacterium]|nr:hypothetical protein [Candidatus Gracilibacteria bacterium]